MSSPTRLALRVLLTMALVWALGMYLPQYVSLSDGIMSAVTVGALLSLLNMFVRPVLNVITFPLKLFATIIAIILANAAFLWIVMQIVALMNPLIVSFQVTGGAIGWIVVSLIIGLANWILKELLHAK